MKIQLQTAIGIITIILLMGSCDQSKNVPLNPNGDSELAILMREMYEDGLKMKKQLQFGGKPSPSIDHSKMLTAEPTEPEKVASEEYIGYTSSYLNVISSMRSVENVNAAKLFTEMVDLCKSCHQSLCPGPIVKIEKLYLDHPLTELR